MFSSFTQNSDVDESDTCQANWRCGEWMPACTDGEIEFNYAWNEEGISIRIIRSCIDLNYCGSIIGRPKVFAHCIKKRKTPEEATEDINNGIKEIEKIEERIKAGSVEPAIAKLDRLQSKWKQAFNDKWDTLRHYHELRDMYDSSPFDVRKKRIDPVEEKVKEYSDAFDLVDGEYSSALRVLRIKGQQASSEWLKVNQEWKNAKGMPKEQRDALERKWRKMEKDSEPLSKLRGQYYMFRREYVEEYEGKYNFDTGELSRHKYDWR